MKRNTNFKNVITHTGHRCIACDEYIKAGTNCITFSRKGEGRHWIHIKCYNKNTQNVTKSCDTYKAIMKSRARLNCNGFDDEGGAIALSEYISCLEDACVECGKCDFSNVLQN